jgi:bis(5'-nucleosyl)-tetraphosphatase (symmetrical)
MTQRVFVGDVQGCADELDALVDRAQADLGSDFELLLTGDLVNRGPASFRVLERVRALQDAGRARTVLGNHDLWAMTVAHGIAPPAAGDTLGELLARSDALEWIDWLRRQPFLIEGTLGATPFALTHASLAPDWSLAGAVRAAAELSAALADVNRAALRALLADAHAARRARKRAAATGVEAASAEITRTRAPGAPDLDALGRFITARSAVPGGGWSELLPEEVAAGEPWHAAWSRAGHSFGVVYGHWALQRLHVAPRLRGLDTGCVHHGRGGDGFLTAWLPDERAHDAFALPDSRFWHEPARRQYWR